MKHADDQLPKDRDVWLTSLWGFDFDKWGALGFTVTADRDRFVRLTRPGVLVAIYVSKGRGPSELSGKVAGVVEVTHETGHLREYTKPDVWSARAASPERNRWINALRVTRAWQVRSAALRSVEEVFPNTYSPEKARHIGKQGVPVDERDLGHAFALDVYEIMVYSG